jgi:hypothetical protein
MSSDVIAAAPGPQLTWNIANYVSQLLHYDFMRNVFIAGTIVSVVDGVCV